MSRAARLTLSLVLLAACAAGLGACGTQGISLAKTDPNYSAAELFVEHCAQGVGSRLRANDALPERFETRFEREQILGPIVDDQDAHGR